MCMCGTTKNHFRPVENCVRGFIENGEQNQPLSQYDKRMLRTELKGENGVSEIMPVYDEI